MKVLLKGYKIGRNVGTAASLSFSPSLSVPRSNMAVGSAGLQFMRAGRVVLNGEGRIGRQCFLTLYRLQSSRKMCVRCKL